MTTVLTTTTAVVGSLGTDPGSGWYESLDKPPWQPPPVAFPLVWTPLYGAIALATGRAIERAEAPRRRRLWAWTAANLTANAAWNWAFFRARSPVAGMAVITVLNGLNAGLVREAWRADRKAGAALTPYAGWVGFATALNASIWRRNR